MAKSAAWGIGKSLDSREAARIAVQQALQGLEGAARPALALAFVSAGLDVDEAVSGISDLLPNVPLWGMSAAGLFSQRGEEGRSVLVGLVAGSKLDASVQFWPESLLSQSQKAARSFRDHVRSLSSSRGLLLALDGLGFNNSSALEALEEFGAPLAVMLGSGDFRSGKTVQFSGEKCGPGAAAAVSLGGRFRMGVGMAHGWHAVGLSFSLTSRSGDLGVQRLNNVPAAEAFAEVFQHPVKEWTNPPLNELARLYPLGFHQEGKPMVVRSTIRVEVDGSLRMNAPLPEDVPAQLMVGDLETCLQAAREAARKALQNLGTARPLLALVLVDLAWQFLFESRSHQFIETVAGELENVPMIGAYTLGQAAVEKGKAVPVLQNQHIQVILIGEAEA